MNRASLAAALAVALLLPAAAQAEAAPADAEAPGAPAATTGKVLGGPDPAELIGPPSGPPLGGAELERRTHEVAVKIRCPVCQGVSVGDSPSEMAQNMKRQTGELLARGYDEEQIIRYFEASYGEFIRLEPKAEGGRLLVWILPGLLLAVGLGVAVRVIRGGKGAPAPAAAAAEEALPARDALPADPELARWVKKVRELAYGWPGGDPPAAKGGA